MQHRPLATHRTRRPRSGGQVLRRVPHRCQRCSFRSPLRCRSHRVISTDELRSNPAPRVVRNLIGRWRSRYGPLCWQPSGRRLLSAVPQPQGASVSHRGRHPTRQRGPPQEALTGPGVEVILGRRGWDRGTPDALPVVNRGCTRIRTGTTLLHYRSPRQSGGQRAANRVRHGGLPSLGARFAQSG